MVRLKVIAKHYYIIKKFIFQFLNGAIKRIFFTVGTTGAPVFQFLNGAIKSFFGWLKQSFIIAFQFLNGAIKSKKVLKRLPEQPYFNSSMVRLKVADVKFVGKFATKFQFLNGAIKR